MNRHVKVTKRARTPKELRHRPVVVAANGRLNPDHVVVGDCEERHTEGAYYLEWYERRNTSDLPLTWTPPPLPAGRRERLAALRFARL